VGEVLPSRPRAVRRAALACFALALAAIATPGARQTPVSLRELPPPGETLEEPLREGDRHDWSLALVSNELVQIVFEPVAFGEADIWPALTVSAPDGQLLYESSEPSLVPSIDGRRRTVVSFVSRSSGSHALRVQARPSAVRYRLWIAQRRASGPEDDERLAAYGLWREAMRLTADGSPASLKLAIDRYTSALQRFRQIADEEGEAITLGAIANIHYRLSDAQQGIIAVERALAIWDGLRRDREHGVALSDRGLLAYLAYQHADARRYYEQALVKHRAAGDARGEAVTLTRIGWVHHVSAELQQALDASRQALQIYRDIGDPVGESVAYNDLGRAYLDLGEVPQALEAFHHALALRPPGRDASGAANILIRIGLAYVNVAEWQQALEALQKARELAQQARNVRAEITAMINLGSTHVTLGGAADGLRYLEPALKLARSIDFRGAEAQALLWMGMAATLDGELQRGRDYLERAIAIQQAINDRRGQATTLRQLAIVQLRLGLADEALKTVARGQELSSVPEGLGHSAGLTLANIHAAMGNAREAEAGYELTIARLREIRARHAEVVALTQYARFQARRDRLIDARELLGSAIELHETLRGLLVDPDLRMNYSTTTLAPYELYTDVLMELARRTPDHRFESVAFDINERARARGLREMLAASGLDIRHGVDRTLVEREREIRWTLNAKAAIQTRLLSGSRDSRRVAALDQEIDQLLREWRQVTNQIRQQSPGYASLTEAQSATAEDIQQTLDPGTVLLEYVNGEEHSWLFVVTPSRLDGYRLGPRSRIEEAARDVHSLLTARQPRENETADARQRRIRSADLKLRSRSRELSELVLGPVAAQLKGEWRGRRLAIVASGPLEYVPFGSLPVPGATNRGRPVALIETNEVVTLPSASTLVLLRQQRARAAASRTIAVFADPVFSADDPRVGRPARPSPARSSREQQVFDDEAPATRDSLARLPFSRAEAAAIVSLLPRGGVLQATDFDASIELATGERLRDYRILHFATHGFINTTRPELSGLALSLVDRQGRSRDGFLRLNTIYNLRLSADLVVLSACQTALGKEVAGEGLIGLTRGFMYAGARAVIATLWQVNDVATAELMKHFYDGLLNRRLPAAAALRRAQLALAKDQRWPSPYYWAGFVLQGDWQ
jgi:CHAT domain-containing protein